MSEPTDAKVGYHVPTTGESEITQINAAVDILTLTGAGSQTGDFLVFQNSSGTEKFVINSDGDIATMTNFADDVQLESGYDVVLNKTGQSAFSKLQLAVLNTAPSSAGLTKGDLWVAKATTDVYRLALCASTAGAATRYGGRFAMSTIGSGDTLKILAGDTLDVSAKGAVGQTSYARLRLPVLSTAPASGNMSKGDLYLAKATTDVYRLAMCISATGGSRYGFRMAQSTIGGGDKLTLTAGDRLDVSGKGAVGQTVFSRLKLAILSTAPTTGLQMGDVWLAAAGTADVYRIAVCISSTNTIRYGHRIDIATMGSTT